LPAKTASNVWDSLNNEGNESSANINGQIQSCTSNPKLKEGTGPGGRDDDDLSAVSSKD
jgi:hypothetical protein